MTRLIYDIIMPMNDKHHKTFLKDISRADDLRYGRSDDHDNPVRLIHFNVGQYRYYVEYSPSYIDTELFKGSPSKISAEITVTKVRPKNAVTFMVYGDKADEMVALIEDQFGISFL